MLISLFISGKTTLVTQLHVVSMEPKGCNLGECSEPRKPSIFLRRIGPTLKKLERFFLGEEYEELAIKKSE